jgi:chemotaxis protein methyltransferase CheR
MTDDQIKSMEIELLLEALRQRHGYDFTAYSRASLERRIEQFALAKGYQRISEIIPAIMWDSVLLKEIVYGISVPVTELFRDPHVFLFIRKNIIPVLKTYPHIKIWNAGCATGQEAYSMAILLREEGIYERCQIYATDFNDVALERAREGIYSIESVKDQTANYISAGGTQSFSDYYHAKYEHIIFEASLRKNIVFANHNLVADAPFGEMHLILCRNVLIYFNQKLQDQVLDLFAQSLIHSGFLCLGTHETLRFASIMPLFKTVDDKCKIYKKQRQTFEST